MQEKTERKVRKKRPLSKGARWALKLTQHICACVAVLCMVALCIKGSVYVEDYGCRRWINGDIRKNEQMAGSFFVNSLRSETINALRFATIRSQLETNGSFDVDRKIHVSEYYYRKKIQSYSSVGQRKYFQDAVYYLEDLIRWQQAGGLIYLSQEYAANQEMILSAKNSLKTQMADNMFLTVDGKRLEELVSTDEDYIELCKQLTACMKDLSDNYNEYQQYSKIYAEGKTSFVYYIYMDNEEGDVFTNNSALVGETKAEIQQYFDSLICAAAGTTALNYNVQGDYDIDVKELASYMSDYDYAFGDNAVVYTGIDISLGGDDYYHTLWEAVASYDINNVYALSGIVILCTLYYLFVSLYMMCAAGRKVTKDGEEYIELKWTDSIVLEGFLTWCAALGLAIALLSCELYEYYMQNSVNYISEVGALAILGVSFLLSVFLLESICSLARRYKSGTLFKNSLIYKFGIAQMVHLWHFLGAKIKKIRQKIQYYMERSGLWEKTWGILLIEVVFYACCLYIMFLFVAAGEEFHGFVIALIILLVIYVNAYRRLRRKIEREEIVEKIEGIVEGESCRVNEDHLSLENAALGHAVNEIGEGIQKAVEQSIKDERLKAELLTNVSHDIKTPLTSIINYVDLLKKEPMESEKATEYIDVLEKKSLKLKNLIQDLIEVSKITTGNIEYEMMPLNLHELIMQAVAEYDEKFAEHCLKLVYNNDAKEACILADSRRMWRVMENLLSNIYKYALEGTRVYIEVNRTENELMLIMKNISARELSVRADELTERFVRGDLSRTTEGSGLGLAIAQNLVIGQGGNFKIMLDGDLFKVQIIFQTYEK